MWLQGRRRVAVYEEEEGGGAADAMSSSTTVLARLRRTTHQAKLSPPHFGVPEQQDTDAACLPTKANV